MVAAPAIDRNKLAADALGIAHGYATRLAKGSEPLAERLKDAATDAILRALALYDPERGPWVKFCMSIVCREVLTTRRRTAQKCAARPAVSALDVEWDTPARDRPAAGDVPMSAELRDLPPDLRDAVRFYHIDGYDLRECGMLMGCSAETVRARLQRAAEMLKPDGVEQPTRAKGERHKVRG